MLALSDAREELLTSNVLTYMTELMKILPTRDFEFMFLADYFMHISQILSHANNLAGTRQIEALVATMCEALKFHLLPYLFEIGLSGLDGEDKHSARLHFQACFLELI